jgi:hypothetical protein
MKKKVVYLVVAVFLMACGSSDDQSLDQGIGPNDSVSSDLELPIPDALASGDGTTPDEGSRPLEDGVILWRDGQRPRRTSDVAPPGEDGTVDPQDVGMAGDLGPFMDPGTVNDGAVPKEDGTPLDGGASPGDVSVPGPMDSGGLDGVVAEDLTVADQGGLPSDSSGPGPTDAGGLVIDAGEVLPDEASVEQDEGSVIELDAGNVADTGPPEQGPCSFSSDCPGGVCVAGLCFYDTGGTNDCEEVVVCMGSCPEDADGCDVDCLNNGDGLAQALYADIWLCWVTAESFFEIAESCAGKAADCFYESTGDMTCEEAYECTVDCGNTFACADDCLEQATSLAQSLYTGLAYCLQGACLGSDDPNCKLNHMMPGGICHIFADLCGNVPEPQ